MVKLGSIASIKTGKLDSNAAESDGIYPFFTCSPDTLRINTYAFDQEAILLAGNNAEGNYTAKYYSGKFNAYQRTYVISSSDSDVYSTRFIGCAITLALKQLKDVSQGTSTKFLTKAILQDLDIPDYSMQDQLRIVSIMGSLEDCIGVLCKINDNLLSQLQLLYNNLLDDASSNIKIGSIAKIYSGGTPNTSTEGYWSGDYNWLSSGETRNRFISSTEKTITKSGVDNSSTRLAHEYDTVIASAGQGLTRGQVSMLFTETYVNQSIIVVNSGEKYAYLIYCNLSNRYEELRNISDSTSIRGSITTKMIADLEIPDVDTELLSGFNNNAENILFKIRSNLKEIRCLSFLRDCLMPKLMSGEIDVSTLEIPN